MAEDGPGDAAVDERAPRNPPRVVAAFASWLIGLRASRSYAFVLLLVVIGFVFAATAPDERWSIGVLLLIQSARPPDRPVDLSRRADRPPHRDPRRGDRGGRRRTGARGPGPWRARAGSLGGLLVAATIVVIVRGVVSHYEVNAQSVIGAITIYMLLGMAVHLHLHGGGRARRRAVLRPGHRRHARRCGCTSASPPSRRSATATTPPPARRAHVRGHGGPGRPGLPGDRRRPPRQPDECRGARRAKGGGEVS